MLSDGRDVPAHTVLETDLCVIGAGPAGLTIARELAGTGMRLTILEAGGTDAGEKGEDDLWELEFSSPHFLAPHDTRPRQFGGMAVSWNAGLVDGTPAARYLPLDPIDFEQRYWVPHSGWPFGAGDLAPYYARAQQLCGLDPARQLLASAGGEGDRAALTSATGALLTNLDRFGPASLFTTGAAAEIAGSANVHVLTHSTAVEVHDDPGAPTISVRARDGRPFAVSSPVVVIAGGAIENARLLLNSTGSHPAGLGNHGDNVGRFYMDHPRVTLGYGSFAEGSERRAMTLYAQHVHDGQNVIGKLKLSEAVMRREALLNGNAQLFPHFLSAEQMAAVRSARIVLGAVRRRTDLRAVPRHALGAARGTASTAGTLLSLGVRLRQHPARASPESWSFGTPVVRSFKLNFQPEQAPSRGNRVTLGERVDAFGFRLPRLKWRWSDLDLDSIRRARNILASELAASGFGDLDETALDGLPESENGGPPSSAHHQLGTTRMHVDPRHGVVDPNLRLHGSGSIYIAGGSVFPTGGHANPTLTVVALSIRLADELKRRRAPVVGVDPR